MAAEESIDNILISYNLIGEEKMARLGALQTKAHAVVAAIVDRDLGPAAGGGDLRPVVVGGGGVGRKRPASRRQPRPFNSPD